MRLYVYILVLLSIFAHANNAELEQILNENGAIVAESEQSQETIDDLQLEKDSLLAEWKVTVKQVEGLKIYNAQKRRQIKAQEERLVLLDEQTIAVEKMQRQVPGVMRKALEGLLVLINEDVPFLMDERNKRIAQVLETFDNPKVTPSENVRQVLEAYNIEREYGRTIETYEDTIVLDGEEKVVNILRIGRLALMYQLKDQSETGVWNGTEWEEVSGYRIPVRDGIRMANKTAPLDLLFLPVKVTKIGKEGGEQ